jgi:hypothetical protein
LLFQGVLTGASVLPGLRGCKNSKEEKIALRLHLSATDIDKVSDDLEGIKRDPERKPDAVRRHFYRHTKSQKNGDDIFPDELD